MFSDVLSRAIDVALLIGMFATKAAIGLMIG